MDYDYFTFRSVTAAMKAGRVLHDAGISSALIRTPQVLRVRGCGYSLRVAQEKQRRAIDTLLRNDARPEKRYRHDTDGTWLEVAL